MNQIHCLIVLQSEEDKRLQEELNMLVEKLLVCISFVFVKCYEHDW